MRRSARSRSRVAAPITALALVLVLAGGCSGDDESDEPDTQRSGSSATDAPGIKTRVEVGDVAGRLPRSRARDAAAKVARVVDGWLNAAYVGGDYPRTKFGDAFPGFTEGAARLAAQQQGLMSNAVVGDRVDEVTAKRRVVTVDLLAPRGRAAGATAHVNLVIKLSGKVHRTEQVRGRLVLTPTKNGWQIFGFDIERGEEKR